MNVSWYFCNMWFYFVSHHSCCESCILWWFDLHSYNFIVVQQRRCECVINVSDKKTETSFVVLPFLLVPTAKRGIKKPKLSRKLVVDQFFQDLPVSSSFNYCVSVTVLNYWMTKWFIILYCCRPWFHKLCVTLCQGSRGNYSRIQ